MKKLLVFLLVSAPLGARTYSGTSLDVRSNLKSSSLPPVTSAIALGRRLDHPAVPAIARKSDGWEQALILSSVEGSKSALKCKANAVPPPTHPEQALSPELVEGSKSALKGWEPTKFKSKSHASKNEIKEKIGVAIKSVLSECSNSISLIGKLLQNSASVSGECGKILCELSSLQKHLITKIEQLLENEPPFKKATSSQLEDAQRVIEQTQKILAQKNVEIKSMRQATSKEMVSQLESIKSARVLMLSTHCLKLS